MLNLMPVRDSLRWNRRVENYFRKKKTIAIVVGEE